jgi:SAM-dependent methyltransferase
MDEALEATKRAERSHFWFRGFRRFILPILEDTSRGRPGLRLLDCGCGTGHNLRLLQRYGRAFGFDLTPSGLAFASETAAPLVRADISSIPFRSQTFDIVTSFDVLQYAADDRATMIELARLMRPGGTLVLTAAAMPILRGGHAAFWPEVRRYDRARMRHVAEGAALHVERVSYLFGTLFPMVLAARMAARLRAPRPNGGDDWEMRVPAAPINGTLSALLAAEAIAGRYVSPPFGSSVLLVAVKPTS